MDAARRGDEGEDLGRAARVRDARAAEQGIAVATEAWDADPWTLNVANGALDLRTGRLEAHQAGRYATKLAPVAYDADATAPRFLRFLE